MLKNKELPEHVKKMFKACMADYKKAYSPFASSYKYYRSSKSSSNKLDHGKFSKVLSLIC